MGKDVAQALGYGPGKSSPNAIASHVDPEDKVGVIKLMTPGGNQPTIIINESGRHGGYMTDSLAR